MPKRTRKTHRLRSSPALSLAMRTMSICSGRESGGDEAQAQDAELDLQHMTD